MLTAFHPSLCHHSPLPILPLPLPRLPFPSSLLPSHTSSDLPTIIMAGVGDITFFTDAETQHYVAEITAVAIMKAAGPMMLGLVVLEALLSLFRLQKTHRLSDTINRYAFHPHFTTTHY